MKNKERIADLERRVAELEARPAQIYYYLPYYQPNWWGTIPPVYPYRGTATTTTVAYNGVVAEANSIVEGARS